MIDDRTPPRPERGMIDPDYQDLYYKVGSDFFADKYPDLDYEAAYIRLLRTVDLREHEGPDDVALLAMAWACEVFHTGSTPCWSATVARFRASLEELLEDPAYESEPSRVARNKLRDLRSLEMAAKLDAQTAVPPVFEEAHIYRRAFWMWWKKIEAAATVEELQPLAHPAMVAAQYEQVPQVFKWATRTLEQWKLDCLRTAWATGEAR